MGETLGPWEGKSLSVTFNLRRKRDEAMLSGQGGEVGSIWAQLLLGLLLSAQPGLSLCWRDRRNQKVARVIQGTEVRCGRDGELALGSEARYWPLLALGHL